MEFVNRNVNPLGKKTGDCVIRSIALATGKSWDEVFKELFAIAFEKKMMVNNKEVYVQYLESLGWVKNKMPRKPDGKRLTVVELSTLYYKTTMLVEISKHMTMVSEGVMTDIWNCGRKSVFNYYTKA